MKASLSSLHPMENIDMYCCESHGVVQDHPIPRPKRILDDGHLGDGSLGDEASRRVVDARG